MKKSLISIALLLTSSAVFAETDYPKNPVLRPLTLADGMISFGGALVVGEEESESRGELNLNAAYGITDDLTIGHGGLLYRFLARPGNQLGLELAVGVGFRGFNDSKDNGEAVAVGLDLNGKYVLSEDTAMHFSLGYVKWDEDELEDKDEYRYSFGLQQSLTKDWTGSIHYTYRDLKDFKQNDAHQVNMGLNYTYSKYTDIGVFAGYSSFDAQENGYKLDHSLDRLAGVYATYRF